MRLQYSFKNVIELMEQTKVNFGKVRQHTSKCEWIILSAVIKQQNLNHE